MAKKAVKPKVIKVKPPKYVWVPASHGEGSSNQLVKVKVED